MSEKPLPPAATAAPYGAVADPFGPHPTPSYGTPAMLSDVKAEEVRTNRAVAAAVAQAEDTAALKSWKAGWIAGSASLIAAIALAFLVWFRNEAMAQQKADNAEAAAKAHADVKIADVKSSVSQVQSSVDTVAYKVDEQNKKLDDLVDAVRELAAKKGGK